MVSLDCLCSNPLNLKDKITKIKHKKYLVTHQKFMLVTSHKNGTIPGTENEEVCKC